MYSKNDFVTNLSACTREKLAPEATKFYNEDILTPFLTHCMCQKNILGTIVCILVIIGALNWGLVGVGYLYSGQEWNLVQMLLGKGQLEAVIYVLVGLAGIYKLVMCSKGCASGNCENMQKPM